MDRFDPFVKYADVYGDIINWEKDPMNKPQNQNKYFFSDGKTYYEQICKMLRLMSVFKEAFNQIYSNEDEISEAWENFVNNLSASVVEGSEPDVTLTWTDDSVNFEFTMVPGVPGERGVGITSISFNSDYTMTITLSDGNTYTSMSLKGETGPQGPQGETGSGLQILDVYATLADLQSAHPTGQPGDAYQVGSGGSYTLYIWSSSQSAWIPAGSLGTVSPSLSNPLMDGTASAGSQNLYSRGDHVHPTDTSRASQEELDALIKTSQSLIDQSFTYRESPAIQDGLAKITDIKGNTIVWNQLVPVDWISTRTFSDGLSVTNNSDGSYTLNGTATQSRFPARNTEIYGVQGHKYYIQLLSSQGKAIITQNNSTVYVFDRAIYTAQNSNAFIIYFNANTYANEKIIPMIIDLTQMSLDISNPSDFTSLFSLPYYSYNQGSLLSFNGTGLKTTGVNQFNGRLYSGQVTSDGRYVTASNRITNVQATQENTAFLHKGIYTVSCQGLDYCSVLTKNEQYQTVDNYANAWKSLPFTFEITENSYLYITLRKSDNTNIEPDYNLQIQSGSSASDYEPYKESSLSLPVSTYFPTGMKSAGNVYDELTESKAITRVGAVDLGSLTWNYVASLNRFDANISDIKQITNESAIPNLVCSAYPTQSWNNHTDKCVTMIKDVSRVCIVDSAYTSATAFKTAMSGVYLFYELETPTETSVDLDMDFMAYEDGTEQLLPVNGIVPATSPIIADMTYLSIDDAMEYIINKLANVPMNTQQILDSLEDDVADLQTDVGTLQPAVSALQTSVGNINTNIGQLSSTVAGHTASISDMQSDITDLNTDLSDLSDTVTDNTSRIGTLESGLSTTNGNVQNLETSVSGLDDTVTAQGTTVTALNDIISDISNTTVSSGLGNHELGFVATSVEATLPANTGTKVTIPKPTIFPNNYTPLFIVGMSTGSYNVSICSIPNTFGNRDSVDCRVWNHGGQQTAQITVYILCMRQRQSQ